MRFIIALLLALSWAIPADGTTEQYLLRARELKTAGEVCIDFDGVGEMTVAFSGDYKWFLRNGAAGHTCKRPARVRSYRIGKKMFCKSMNTKLHELRAPEFADEWLDKRQWRKGSCLDAYGDYADLNITMSARMKVKDETSRCRRRSRDSSSGSRSSRNRSPHTSNRNRNKNCERDQRNRSRNHDPRRRRGDPRKRKRRFDRNRRRFDRDPKRRHGHRNPRNRKRRFDRNRMRFDHNRWGFDRDFEFKQKFDNNQRRFA